MFCPNCGAQISDEAAFCPHCGSPAALPDNTESPAQEPDTQRNGPRHAAKPARRGKARRIILAAAVVVLGVLAALNWKGLSNFALRSFGSPERYYQYVETRAADDLSAAVAGVYGSLLERAQPVEQRVSGSVSFELGDAARDLIGDYAGYFLYGFDDDLSWFETLSLAYQSDYKDGLNGTDATLRLNGTDLLSLSLVVDPKDETAYVAVPELNEDYFEVELDDLSGSRYGYYGYRLPYRLRSLDAPDMETLLDVLDALPDEAAAEKLLRRYLALAIESVDDVKKGKETLIVDGVSAKYTTLTAEINGDTAARIIETVGKEARSDKDLRKLIVAVADAAGRDGEDVYDEILDALEDLIDRADDVGDRIDDMDLEMTVYVDGAGGLCGRVIEGGDFRYAALSARKNGKFGVELSAEQYGDETFLLTGGGTYRGYKLSGTLELEIDGVYYGAFDAEELDAAKLADGALSGTLAFRPSTRLWSALGLPSAAISIVRDFSLRAELDSGKNRSTLRVSLLDDADLLCALTADAAVSGAKKVAAVSGAVEPGKWAEDISGSDLRELLDALEAAGAPEKYTGYLDGRLDYLF